MMWGLTLAYLFARKPVFTFGEAAAKALKVMLPVQVVLALLLFGMFRGLTPSAELGPLLVEVVLTAGASSLVWAYFMARKARRLAVQYWDEKEKACTAMQTASGPGTTGPNGEAIAPAGWRCPDCGKPAISTQAKSSWVCEDMHQHPVPSFPAS